MERSRGGKTSPTATEGVHGRKTWSQWVKGEAITGKMEKEDDGTVKMGHSEGTRQSLRSKSLGGKRRFKGEKIATFKGRTMRKDDLTKGGMQKLKLKKERGVRKGNRLL